MSCHELNEQNEAGDDEGEEYEEENIVLENTVEEFPHFEINNIWKKMKP